MKIITDREIVHSNCCGSSFDGDTMNSYAGGEGWKKLKGKVTGLYNKVKDGKAIKAADSLLAKDKANVSPEATVTNIPDAAPAKKAGLSTLAIVGISAGGLAVLGLGWWLVTRK